MAAVNLRTTALDGVSDRPGWRSRSARVGDRLDAQKIGGTLYELHEGEQTFPYHYHHGVEEWLLVVDGEPSVRTPIGERRLRAGDLVCFPVGSKGAHVVRGPGRFLLLSANREPSIAVYPDSEKLGTRPRAGASEDLLNFRRADAVNYWEGE